MIDYWPSGLREQLRMTLGRQRPEVLSLLQMGIYIKNGFGTLD